MRGLTKEVIKPQDFLYTARDNFRLHGVEYKKGQLFSYDGDPARLLGLADAGLHPAVTTGNRMSLSWLSPINRADGYGGLAEDAINGLLKEGVEVTLGHIGLVAEYPDSPAIKKLLEEPLKVTRLGLIMAPPDSSIVGNRVIRQDGTHGMLLPAMRQQYRILYTMFETDKIPDNWVDRINRFIDAVFVPSSFLVDVFKKCGVTVPVYHTPTGVDHEFYVPGPRQKKRCATTKDAKPEDDETRVLLAANLTRRKNAAAAIRAFQAASKGDPKWRLTIKTQITQDFDEHVLKPVQDAKDDRITLITDRYTREEMLKLYQSHDIFLWPTLGEGIGLPPMEAMSCGLEVVASMSSGGLDYLSDKVAYPVETKLVHSGYKAPYDVDWGDTGRWWQPDEEQLAAQLLAAATNGIGKIARGVKAREAIVKEHGKTVSGSSIKTTIEQHILPLLKEPK